MKRRHFFEIEDQDWCPTIIRNGITDFLQYIVYFFHLYKPITKRLSIIFAQQNTKKIVDLCSGGGGPWLSMLSNLTPDLDHRLSIHLTDLYPNLPAFHLLSKNKQLEIKYHPTPVSALDVPAELVGFRTLFSSFHHFKPEQAQQIISDAITKNQEIAIFESTQRHPLLIAYMLLVPFIVLIITPFIRPFQLSRLFFTYIIPVIPVAVMFDGIVSCLRTYTPDELSQMVKNIPEHDKYEWEIGIEKIGILPVGITYLIGFPKKQSG